METITRTHAASLFDGGDLADAIEDGYVRTQTHPTLGLRVFNYTELTAYEQAWDNVTTVCRGLVLDGAGWIVARPWAKFHNHGNPAAPPLDLTSPVEVTDKADGSLGILYPAGDEWAIATRGSFGSAQAVHATQVLHERYPCFRPPPGVTVLVEIVYPANRIVLDYGGVDNLILLGGVDIATGRPLGPADIPDWMGPVVETFPAATLADALAMEPRPNAEGIVVRFIDSGHMIKIKQADYMALHLILTRTSARSLWEFSASNACQHLVTKPKDWGTLLHTDPARAIRALAVGPYWMLKLIEGVPDEFHAWVRSTVMGMNTRVAELLQELTDFAALARFVYGTDRKAMVAELRHHPHSGALFALYEDKDISAYLWRHVYPDAETPWMTVSEDNA